MGPIVFGFFQMFDQKGNNGHESIVSFLTQQRTGDLPDYSSYIREKRKIRTPVLKTPCLVMKKISSGSGYKAKVTHLRKFVNE